MDVETFAIAGPLLIRTRRIADPRGYLTETWSARRFGEAGIDVAFVQDNQSFSHSAGTVRGLHAQRPPQAQAKLVRVLRGAAYDVALDLRSGSPTYGQHVSATLTEDGGEQLFIPEGFAHGFCTLVDGTTLAYRLSGVHAPEAEAGVAWDDPNLDIAWPLGGRAAILSDRDRALPRLATSGLTL